MQITSISRQRLGDRLVVASISDRKDSTALALGGCVRSGLRESDESEADPPRLQTEALAPLRWIGHDHLEALGISADRIREWLASGVLTSPRGDGFYLRGAAFEQAFEPLVVRQTVGRGHLLALGVTTATIAKWLRWGTLRRTCHIGFYTIIRAAFEALRPARPPITECLAIEATVSPAPMPTEESSAAHPVLTPVPVPPRLRIVASTITRARAFVAEHHRHLGAPVSGLFAVGLACGDDLVGVAIVGRPVARALQVDGTAEITRLCTLGDRNACSMLLAACRRGSSALGYSKLITYTLASEPGTSLRAAGWVEVAKVKGRSWHCASRPRAERASPDKRRWEPSPGRSPQSPLALSGAAVHVAP